MLSCVTQKMSSPKSEGYVKWDHCLTFKPLFRAIRERYFVTVLGLLQSEYLCPISLNSTNNYWHYNFMYKAFLTQKTTCWNLGEHYRSLVIHTPTGSATTPGSWLLHEDGSSQFWILITDSEESREVHEQHYLPYSFRGSPEARKLLGF